jgi:hypothetical protein
MSEHASSNSERRLSTEFALVRTNATRDHTAMPAWRWKVQEVVESRWFLIFITLCILINTAFLASDRYPIDAESQRTIEIANLVFYCIFVLEMVLKLIGLGVRGYCKESFNVFDGFIVILSTVEVALFYSGDSSGFSSGGAISAFRAFRLLRLFKLARTWTSLKNILQTMQNTLFDISYFSILMMLFITIYALLGMEFFAHRLKFDDSYEVVEGGGGRSPRVNFDDFFHAFEAIFIVLVGDDW